MPRVSDERVPVLGAPPYDALGEPFSTISPPDGGSADTGGYFRSERRRLRIHQLGAGTEQHDVWKSCPSTFLINIVFIQFPTKGLFYELNPLYNL